MDYSVHFINFVFVIISKHHQPLKPHALPIDHHRSFGSRRHKQHRLSQIPPTPARRGVVHPRPRRHRHRRCITTTIPRRGKYATDVDLEEGSGGLGHVEENAVFACVLFCFVYGFVFVWMVGGGMVAFRWLYVCVYEQMSQKFTYGRDGRGLRRRRCSPQRRPPRRIPPPPPPDEINDK